MVTQITRSAVGAAKTRPWLSVKAEPHPLTPPSRDQEILSHDHVMLEPPTPLWLEIPQRGPACYWRHIHYSIRLSRLRRTLPKKNSRWPHGLQQEQKADGREELWSTSLGRLAFCYFWLPIFTPVAAGKFSSLGVHISLKTDTFCGASREDGTSFFVASGAAAFCDVWAVTAGKTSGDATSAAASEIKSSDEKGAAAKREYLKKG